MCNCGKSCASCKSASNADGTQTYDPVQVAQWINKYIPQATTEDMKQAYPKVMVYLESKGITPSEEAIKNNTEDLKKVISDPNFLQKQNVENHASSAMKIMGVVVIAIAVLLLIKNL